MIELNDLGTCPAREHSVTYPQCGYGGCVDLRLWAKAHRYRYRLEESYKAEINMHVKGDGRWFVEILCKNGLIYPYGGRILLAYANGGVVLDMTRLGITPYQADGKARVFKFPVERLDEIAAILKPKRLPGTAEPTDKQRETLQRYAFKGGQTHQGT
jgi:hypothetical protein